MDKAKVGTGTVKAFSKEKSGAETVPAAKGAERKNVTKRAITTVCKKYKHSPGLAD